MKSIPEFQELRTIRIVKRLPSLFDFKESFLCYTVMSQIIPVFQEMRAIIKLWANLKKNGILLPKLFWLAVRKNCTCDREKPLEIRGWRPRICKIFEITRTIYTNSARSEQFLETDCFFNLFLEVPHILWTRKIIIQIGKNHWDSETCRKI